MTNSIDMRFRLPGPHLHGGQAVCLVAQLSHQGLGLVDAVLQEYIPYLANDKRSKKWLLQEANQGPHFCMRRAMWIVKCVQAPSCLHVRRGVLARKPTHSAPSMFSSRMKAQAPGPAGRWRPSASRRAAARAAVRATPAARPTPRGGRRPRPWGGRPARAPGAPPAARTPCAPTQRQQRRQERFGEQRESLALWRLPGACPRHHQRAHGRGTFAHADARRSTPRQECWQTCLLAACMAAMLACTGTCSSVMSTGGGSLLSRGPSVGSSSCRARWSLCSSAKRLHDSIQDAVF